MTDADLEKMARDATLGGMGDAFAANQTRHILSALRAVRDASAPKRGSYLCPKCGSESRQRTGYGNEHLWKCPQCETEHEPWASAPKPLPVSGETPRTNTFIGRYDAFPPQVEWKDFARQLERELNEANRRVQSLQRIIDHAGSAQTGYGNAVTVEIERLLARAMSAEALLQAQSEDTKRLDWLSDPTQIYYVELQRQPDGETIPTAGLNLRQVIDRAMERKPE